MDQKDLGIVRKKFETKKCIILTWFNNLKTDKWNYFYFQAARFIISYCCNIDLASIATLPTKVGDGLEEQDMYSP